MDDAVTISCPSCGESLEFSPQDLDTLAEYDLIECPACAAELEVVQLDPLEVLVIEGGENHEYFVDCPRCESSIAVHKNDEGESVTCEECGYRFVPDWTDIHDADEEGDYQSL